MKALKCSQPSSPTLSLQKSLQEKTEFEYAAGGGPLIILAFDEAHTLTERKSTNSIQWSIFSEMRHALRALHRFACFSLFMSTTGKISQFISAPAEDVSLRILSGNLTQIEPFTALGFDTLAHKISLLGGYDLVYLTSNQHMAHLGRPLYVFPALSI